MLKKLLIGFVLNGLALYGVTLVVDGIRYTGSPWTFFIIGGVIIGILNTVIKPLIKAFAFPVIILTAGLFLIVVNGIILWLTHYIINVAAFRDVTMTVLQTTDYIIGGIIFGIINWVEHMAVKNV